MNNLLRNIIETRNIIIFINNIIIGIEIEEEYNNIVKEVLRRIVEVKLEKYIYSWQI